jgi:hypothetical protein
VDRCGDRYAAIAMVADLGTIALLQGDTAGAIEWFRRTLVLAQELGELFMAER